MPLKRKGKNSPQTQQQIAAASKYRKAQNGDLPTGELNEEDDMDVSDEFLDVLSPSKKTAQKSLPISIITVEIVKVNF